MRARLPHVGGGRGTGARARPVRDKDFYGRTGWHPPRPPSPPSRPNRMSDGPDDPVDGVLESRGDEQIAVATADAAGYAAASLCCRVSCRSRLLWRVRVAGACQVRADPVEGNDARNAGEESADAPLGQGWWQ